jgi:hypothetical protein
VPRRLDEDLKLGPFDPEVDALQLELPRQESIMPTTSAPVVEPNTGRILQNHEENYV